MPNERSPSTTVKHSLAVIAVLVLAGISHQTGAARETGSGRQVPAD
jgi:hypothetical protein